MQISPTCRLLATLSLLTAFPSLAHGQFGDDVSQLRLDQLRQGDSLLRSEISSARVDRQVEISRLEGRILQLEQKLRWLPQDSDSTQLAFVLGLAASLDDPQVERPPAPKQTTGVDDRLSTDRDDQIVELVVRDYMMATEVRLLDMRSHLLEKTQELKSVERLASKGLASSVQLDQLVLHKRRAELELERLTQRLAGIRQIYPQFVAEKTGD